MTYAGLKSCAAFTTGLALVTAPVAAVAKDAPELVRCEESLGSIAVVDGAGAGWSQWGLGSPRELVNALAAESGCFTPHQGTDGTPARYLVTAIAGSQEEVDEGINIAKSAATEALLRTGALSSVASKIPFAGSALGVFGGFGGKKKTVAAGLKVVSPATGQPIAGGSGSVKKSQLTFGRGGAGWVTTAASASGYQDSKDGRMLTEAFVIAFNELVSQKAALELAPQSAASPAASASIVAVDTVMRSAASSSAAEVRSLRAGSEVTPTGKREGLFIEVSDNYGTTGWVSVEDMQ